VLVFKEPANLWLRPAMLARVKVSSPMLERLFTCTPSDTTNRLLMHYDRAWSWKSTSRCHDQTNVALSGSGWSTVAWYFSALAVMPSHLLWQVVVD